MDTGLAVISIIGLYVLISMENWNRPFPHSTSVRTNNRTRARLGWTFSYICCIFVHSNLDSVPLFVGMRERSIRKFYRILNFYYQLYPTLFF